MSARITFELTEGAGTQIVDIRDVVDIINYYVGLNIFNSSIQTLYFRLQIIDPSGNWTFDDGTTLKDLGSVNPAAVARLCVLLKRSKPPVGTEETITLKLLMYTDSEYTNKLDEKSQTITFVFIDTSQLTVIDESTFDDGSEDGWTLTGFSVSDEMSINAGGYSLKLADRTSSTSFKTLVGTAEKSIVLPAMNKIYIRLYALRKMWAYGASYGTIRIYVNGELVSQFMLHYRAVPSGETGYDGWFNIVADISKYAGTPVTIKVEVEMRYRSTSVSYVPYTIVYIDEILICGE